VTKLVTGLVVLTVGVVALAAATPALSKLVSSLTTPIVAAGVVVCLVRIVWSATRRW
jgi:hypothetical protein